MKVAIAGVWHVHAKEYTETAKKFGEVIGIYDRDPVFAENFAKECNLPVFDTFENLLESDAEGVIVCSASSDHADMMVAIANRGKHIFTEKVLALTVEDCLRVKEAVEKNGVNFVISMPQRCMPGPLTVKALIDDGKLGQINYIRFRNCHNGSSAHWLPAHFYNEKETGGGAMIDLGAHGMYLIDWLLGEPETYSSTFTHVCRDEKDAILNPSKLEDNAVTVMSYPDGAIAVNETGFVSSGSPMTLEVGGNLGYVHFDGKVILNASSTGFRPTEIPMEAGKDLPIVQFMKGLSPSDCSINDAIALTRMMVGAYSARIR